VANAHSDIAMEYSRRRGINSHTDFRRCLSAKLQFLAWNCLVVWSKIKTGTMDVLTTIRS